MLTELLIGFGVYLGLLTLIVGLNDNTCPVNRGSDKRL